MLIYPNVEQSNIYEPAKRNYKMLPIKTSIADKNDECIKKTRNPDGSVPSTDYFYIIGKVNEEL